MARVLLLSNPRSGSTLLASLLSSHPNIGIGEELLNDEENVPSAESEALSYLEQKVAAYSKRIKGFKLFPEQIFNRSINFTQLVNHLNITYVIVLWREDSLETFASLLIARRTGKWYSDKDASDYTEQVCVDVPEFEQYLNTLKSNWTLIGNHWPAHVRPIFVKFEELVSDPKAVCAKVLTMLSCTHTLLKSYSKRMNPAPLQDKISNYHDIPEKLRNTKFNAQELITLGIQASLRVPVELLHLVPDREPVPPSTDWVYRIAKPYINQAMKDNVAAAMESGIISSAGHTVEKMSEKLKSIFKAPVALPCSNGFSAIMVVLQTIGLNSNDEVILPSLTMVAVANAVHFVGGKLIFADSSVDNYNPGFDEIVRVSGDNTKVVILTHTYGVPNPELERIQKLCIEKGWWLIEDISECVGVTVATVHGDRLLGTFGDFACSSLYANKMIQAGDGGFILCQTPALRPRLMSLLNHGFTPSFHFVHFEPAINAKINGLGAAVCTASLDSLNFIMEHRQILAKQYRNNLKYLPVTLMPEAGSKDTPWVFGLVCETKEVRTDLRQVLANNGIETRDFFFPLHLQPAYNNTIAERLPNAEEFGCKGFYLPTYTDLTEADIQHICCFIRAFFIGDAQMLQADVVHGNHVPMPNHRDSPQQVKNGYQKTKDTVPADVQRSELQMIVQLEQRIKDCVLKESWDTQNLLLRDIKENKWNFKDAGLKMTFKNDFDLYIGYLESQQQYDINYERRPWLNEILQLPENPQALNITSTTEPETLQFLTWLIKSFKPKVIWEFGTWLGLEHATARIAITAKLNNPKSKVLTSDGFKWQHWMNRHLKNDESQLQGKSFLSLFKNNISSLENIEAISWHVDAEPLPVSLCNPANSPHLVYLDITQKADDLEQLWDQIKPHLIPDKTILVFHGFVRSSLEFFTRHAANLLPVAKPGSITKVFRYVKPKQVNSNIPYELPPLQMVPRKLNFHANPNWSHHCQNAFGQVIDALRAEFHDPNAEVTFVPAIEETFSDNPEVLLKPWVGIIHSVVSHPEFFYSPDLTRLCSREYSMGMNHCKGLFTLTTFQAEYLKTNLGRNIPIHAIKLPMIQPSSSSIGSTVIEAWKRNVNIDLILVGEFARDFELFNSCKVPNRLRKVVLGGSGIPINSGITILPRLSDEDYDQKLKDSIVFLSLKYEGAANTIMLECIARNVPILVPNFSTCLEYIGKNYPLTYEVGESRASKDLTQILTLERIQSAIEYLQSMDKNHLTIDHFVQSVKSSFVLLSLNPGHITSKEEVIPKPQRFDVTISICSYKRTKNLPKLLDSLWNNQDFSGTFQIILWNNNVARTTVVQEICAEYLAKSNEQRYLEIINSTDNYYCSVRLALAQIMKSAVLLVVDDDISPRPSFISFFMEAYRRYPSNLLCVRGHVFLPHEMEENNSTKVWKEYENLRFKSETDPEQFVHFVHADTCVIPKSALHECASVEMPDDSFKLVDDYWMSYVLNHKFGRQLRKLTTKSLKEPPFDRTEDSDTPGLALHTRPEVRDARVRLYIHHMLNGWPKKEPHQPKLKSNPAKVNEIWKSRFIGFNISSQIDEDGIISLAHLGVKVVRIGAVGINGVGAGYTSEFDGLQSNPLKEIERLKDVLKLLGSHFISAVITLQPDLATPFNWKCIAEKLGEIENVVGYDLINEPNTVEDQNLHISEVPSLEIDENRCSQVQKYVELIQIIREVDKITPVIIEPTFWANLHALELLQIEQILAIDSNIIVSFHFYEPKHLTQREHNKSRYEFPGPVPVYQGKFSEKIIWDRSHVKKRLQVATEWASKHKVRIFLGEFGICRDIAGAESYLQAVMDACGDLELSGFVFGFRDDFWDAMNYEFGSKASNFKNIPLHENTLLQNIQTHIAKINDVVIQ